MRGVKEKVKFPLWIRPDIMEQVRAAYAEDDCRSQSEYIEQAIKFYLAYTTTEQKDSRAEEPSLPPTVTKVRPPPDAG